MSARDATPIDCALLSGVIGLVGKTPDTHPVSVKQAIGAFDLALSAGSIDGKVTDRTVRALFSALERSTPNLRIDHVPNPFMPPHNLSWYFGVCACPQDVRVFATMLSKGNVRVWSVAQDASGWKVLVQVFGAGSTVESALSIMRTNARVPAGRLKNFALSDILPFDMHFDNIELFMHEYARKVLQQQGRGDFVELSLVRKYT